MEGGTSTMQRKARMNDDFNPISMVTTGSIKWKLCVRVLRLWRSRDFNDTKKLNNLEAVLVDENGDRIHAQIRSELVSKYENLLSEGKTVIIEKVMVYTAKDKLRPTQHECKLSFIRHTVVTPIKYDGITKELFKFVTFADILDDKVKAGFMIDIIGHVIQKDYLIEKEADGKSSRRIDVIIEDLQKKTILCTLWGEFADRMVKTLENNKSNEAIVMLLHQCMIKTFKDVKGISNAFHGTIMYINEKLPEIDDYYAQLSDKEVTVTQLMSQMSANSGMSELEEILQTQKMSIAELIEVKEKSFVAVLATIVDVDLTKDLVYEACGTHARRLQNVVNGKGFCDKCRDIVDITYRYMLSVNVIDPTGSTTFVMFDNLVTKLIGKPAAVVKELMDRGEIESDLIPEIESMLDNVFIFKVAITEDNFKTGWQSYTVKVISDKEDLVNQFELSQSVQDVNDHDIEETPVSKSSSSSKRSFETFDITKDDDDGRTQASATTNRQKKLTKKALKNLISEDDD